ncbi:MaoC/PaaZ C-terminal domain-containing protein [Metabacillus rhizolycopersici]|uniref:MaoC family dehydratase N-terminal domain-containing protein n=1 Tax=Metabacillus rhizolycopersici TaxID=2875709 RepID=A0ABS7UWC9_9BACI|nr:MaoC/PaaZ C-terminal domain-containing protein [Metabacillus rhizolycopersici]MBZ5752245.1 MaoC family dehydratase N-terminal domain-containing protein [Metabacillus rhizolycopersici]
MKTISFQVTERDIVEYANVSGDFNPIHLDEKHAQQQGFESKIAHGMLTMAKVWSILSNELLSPEILPLKYDLSFLNPVYVGDHVTLQITKRENKIQLEGKSANKTIIKGAIVLQNAMID